MQVNRSLLLSAIESIKPALASKEMIEELCCVWLDGKYAIAYNDSSLGMRVPLQCDLKGGIRGNLLLGILTHSRAKEFSVTLEDEVAELKSGRSRFKLTLLAQDRCPWSLPDINKADPIQVSMEFLEALETVRISIGTGTTRAEQLGVTIYREETDLCMFTTDSNSVSSYSLPIPDNWPKKLGRVIWPTPFIDQLLKLKKLKHYLEIWPRENDVTAHYEGLMIYSRTVNNLKPVDFRKIENENKSNKSTPIPKKLRLSMERACILLNGQPNEKLEILYDGENIKLMSQTPRGSLTDNMNVSSPLEERKYSINPELLKRAIPLCDTITFAPRSIVLSNKQFSYYLSAA